VELALIVLHPNNKNFKKYKLNMLNAEVAEILAARKRAVDRGAGAIYEFADEEEEGEEDPKPCFSQNPMFLDDD
jgi:hypothetical protein